MVVVDVSNIYCVREGEIGRRWGGGETVCVCVFVYFSVLLDVIVPMLACRCDCES